MASPIEYKAYGTEPVWENIKFSDAISQQCAFQKALNWYNYMSDEKDYKTWVLEYCKKQKKDQEIIKIINDISADKMIVVNGIKPGPLARMICNGAKLENDVVASLEDAISTLYTTHKNTKNKIENNNETKKEDEKNIQDFIQESFSKIIYPIERQIDTILHKTSDKSINIETYINETKPLFCKKIIEYLKTSYQDLQKIEEDDEIKSAYQVYDKKTIKSAIAFIDKTIELSSKKLNNLPKQTRVRKQRKKSPIDIVKKLQFAKTNEQYKLNSILPSKIVGASKLLIFNVKTRMVTLFEANSSHGLSVKGTTILHFDEKTSKCKKLRKPELFFQKINGKGVRVVKNAIEELKCKESKVKGRINEDTILIEVY